MLKIEGLIFLLSLVVSVLSIPVWENINNRESLGSLVSGTSYLEAMGSVRRTQQTHKPNYLSIDAPKGSTGHAIIKQDPMPPLFFINHHQLWQYQNESYIFPVNVINSTLTADAPLQLSVGKKREGLAGGLWRWRGTMLYYDQGDKSNKGAYLSCLDKSGARGVFMFLDSSPTPRGCETITIHSFVRKGNGR
ncbi:hypothetical protein SERLA73DRAFT_79089 [Serpula lacrymans var. lacrymans S7.3]|uniref:Uncharacterized protein n=2 Tax=Serpula lacrymans var. lacrymans TaxID=341189 RepID=F8QF87_SERL3|nr:uncharacterized protein SERLADRAFT_435651 [Serpula lacrymans var. lacrymans S7.9]EGN93046.1 hypothetical protein SERLA73DRAFT_79089 [Serpula lacrymans var. lacrymans S7.3]EGO27884.1 hypothetical protein SERLADRAFT_435651 [Serpula lacrymans var. lacrymans S7.9]